MRPAPLTSQITRGGQTTGFPVDVEGVVYRPIERRLEDESCRHGRLSWARWLLPIGKTLTYVRFLEDFPAFPYTNLWGDTVTPAWPIRRSTLARRTRGSLSALLMTSSPTPDLLRLDSTIRKLAYERIHVTVDRLLSRAPSTSGVASSGAHPHCPNW
jgi:adenine-specific DNA-methyltransferase